MRMDEDLGRRVFCQMVRDDEEISALNIPAVNMPKNLRNLLYIGYASDNDKDSPTKSGGSGKSDGSESLSGNSSTKEWAHIFADDGSLRFDDILSLLPPESKKLCEERELSLYVDTLRCAELGLLHYNANNKGAEYELVAPLLSHIFFNAEHFFIRHANFLARPQNTNSPPELFFAEVVPDNFLKTDDQDPVLRCSIVKPLLGGPSLDEDAVSVTPPPRWIYHPEGVDCSSCNWDEAGDESDDDW